MFVAHRIRLCLTVVIADAQDNSSSTANGASKRIQVRTIERRRGSTGRWRSGCRAGSDRSARDLRSGAKVTADRCKSGEGNSASLGPASQSRQCFPLQGTSPWDVDGSRCKLALNRTGHDITSSKAVSKDKDGDSAPSFRAPSTVSVSCVHCVGPCSNRTVSSFWRRWLPCSTSSTRGFAAPTHERLQDAHPTRWCLRYIFNQFQQRGEVCER